MCSKRLLAGFSIAMLLTLAPASVASSGMERLDPGVFAGFWEFPEPAGDTFVMIIKRGGDVSGFWSGAGTGRIVRGEWIIEDDELRTRWDSGHRDVLTVAGENSLQRRAYEPGADLDGAPSHTTRGTRIDPRRPGSLAVNRDPESRDPQIGSADDPHTAPSIPLRNAFTGFWRARQSTGFMGIGGAENPEFYLHLQRSGRAITALRGRSGDGNVFGRWRIDGDNAIIEWGDGSRDVIRSSGSDSFQLMSYRARDVRSGRPQSTRSVEKMDPAEGMRYFQAGDFQLLTVADIRGTWQPEESGESPDHIEIEGWGNAYRPKAGDPGSTEAGNWRLHSDRVSILWASGERDVIRITERGFVQESYARADDTQPRRTRMVGRVR